MSVTVAIQLSSVNACSTSGGWLIDWLIISAGGVTLTDTNLNRVVY